MAWQEDPDRALARWAAQDEERMLAGEKAERVDDYTPAEDRLLGALSGEPSGRRERRSPGGEGRRITSAMSVLAWTVLNGSSYDAREASKVLAELVLEADQQTTQ